MKEQLAGNIARLLARRRDEDARASASGRLAEQITSVAGSMTFIVLHVAFYGGLLLVLTDAIPFPVPIGEGLALIGSVASIEAISLLLFVLMNQRREEQRADSRADFTLHASLLTEDELTKLAIVIYRIADRMGVQIDEVAAEEVEKNIDPEQMEGEGGAPGHAAVRHEAGAAAGEPPAMKASTAS